MKKTLLALALISASQTMPWNPFNTAGDIVVGAAETPGVVLAGDRYTVSDRREDRRTRREERDIRSDEQRTRREEQQLNRDERRYKNGYDQNGYDQNGRRRTRGWFN